ncbi:MAG: putative lipid II flippase FtsW [Lachnospiraceae bacterium]|nr:putative lipid II flippase FtsW [Lachnospiraceae bacterium]
MSHGKVKRRHMDYSLFFAVIFLLLFGLIMVYSASSYEASLKFNDSAFYLKNQARATALGFIAMLIISRIDYHIWKGPAFLIYLGSLFLVFLVLTPLGVVRNGARRWLDVGISVQPAEVAKVGVILLFASILSRYGKQLSSTLKGIFICTVLAGIPAVMVLTITSNMSSAIIIFGIATVMVFVCSQKTLPFMLIGGAITGGAALIVYMVMHGIIPETLSYRTARIRAWLQPEAYASGTGYQTLQSLYSIGAGGIFGKGLGQSTQKLGFVPEAQNDMIFSIICEELGLFGAIAILLMFVILIWRFVIVANNASDQFGAFIVTGVMAHIAIQVILNIAVVTNTIPNTGITLPFISYGGTSILFLLYEIGLCLSVSRSIEV